MMTLEISMGVRVEDKQGFTGTVTDFEMGDEVVEVTWDISGCTSDINVSELIPERIGQRHKQEEIHSRIFGS